MDAFVKPFKRLPVLLVAVALFLLAACSSHETISEKDFVGKWKSSRMVTPIYLYANGEWEIKNDEGTILQYGVWQYKNMKMIWSYKVDSNIGHDANHVLSATPREFQIQEADRSTTTFNKLD